MGSAPSFAASCSVLQHPAPSPAETAFLSGDFAKAEELFRAGLAQDPAQPDSAIGLVHSLLREQKVLEAEDEIRSLIADKPAPASLLTLRAEVEMRQGEPWKASETAAASAKLDPCNPRTYLVIARISALTSKSALAQKLIATARQLDPEDSEIRAAWIDTLPPDQRIRELESYLAAPRGDDAETLSDRKSELEELKNWAQHPHPPCTLISKTQSTELPFTSLRTVRGDVQAAAAVDVKINGHNARFSIDTSYNPRLPLDDVSGFLILKPAAEHMGLKPLFQNSVPGIGHQGPRAGYVAYADTISIGNLEFHDCTVQVMEGNYWSDADGSFSMNMLSGLLITLDYPNYRFSLSPLPQVSELQDYTQVYRTGTDLILPVIVNTKIPKLFVIDSAMAYSMLSSEASHEIAEGHKDIKYEVRDTSGQVDTRFSAGDVSLTFAKMTQYVTHIPSFDTSRFSRDAGMAISGFIGDATLRSVVLHIDYRDGLVKFDFDPKHPNVTSR